ncbi:MAG: PPOX class F420-dependent oxidoreductase [Chloroflexota bacterium]|nr:PPOX class F420-dependent oxidoreductase [Chloroflexota bacterium]
MIDDKIRAFLSEPRFAVVATIQPDGMPHQTVLWYELQGEEIMVNTARGRVKDHNLARDPRMSFCVEDGYRYVTLSGPVELIADQQQAQDDIRRLAIRYHGEERGEEMSRTSFAQQERLSVRMRVEQIDAQGF